MCYVLDQFLGEQQLIYQFSNSAQCLQLKCGFPYIVSEARFWYPSLYNHDSKLATSL